MQLEQGVRKWPGKVRHSHVETTFVLGSWDEIKETRSQTRGHPAMARRRPRHSGACGGRTNLVQNRSRRRYLPRARARVLRSASIYTPFPESLVSPCLRPRDSDKRRELEKRSKGGSIIGEKTQLVRKHLIRSEIVVLWSKRRLLQNDLLLYAGLEDCIDGVTRRIQTALSWLLDLEAVPKVARKRHPRQHGF